jgi:alpha-mannosidase
MISDVPGYTWGIVPTMAQAGVKYFSIGSNLADRIGRTLSTWEDKPFYWLSPDGRQKVLCWIPYKGYALVFWAPGGFSVEKTLVSHLAQLEQQGYPYDMVQLRWTVGGDNGHPDADLPDMVKNWNAAHQNPKLVIATTSELFQKFEQRYADKIPVVSGDFTPYWEDGAGSSARETALTRMAAERLVQAEALYAMLQPKQYPAEQFSDAWRNVILYNEHTWGAHNSITEPDQQFVKDQWKTKQAFALDADVQSRKLLESALAEREDPTSSPLVTDNILGMVDVFNTSAWLRTDLVVVSKDDGKEYSKADDCRVRDSEGKAVVSQRLSTGELAFLAKDVPAFGSKRYVIGKPLASETAAKGSAKVEGTSIFSSDLTVQLEPATGVIKSLQSRGDGVELCDMTSGVGLNHYDYVLADRVKEAQSSGPAKITVKENGPLVASLLVESDAPGCKKFTREIRVVDGLNRVDIVNVIDKTAVREKEGVHLGFAFNVPNGTMRLDVPWAVVRPELDQMPGACKNWFCVGRWADVSNQDYGVTWASLDAPLLEVGGITADKMGPQSNPDAWLAKLEPSQTFYSWVMNNHWYTNYRADQEGPTTFRYVLRPHRQYDPMATQRFGMECSQPLVAVPVEKGTVAPGLGVEVKGDNVLIASVKPSEDRKAWILRLFNVGDQNSQAVLQWGTRPPAAVWCSNLSEEKGTQIAGAVEVPAHGIVTLRADRLE